MYPAHSVCRWLAGTRSVPDRLESRKLFVTISLSGRAINLGRGGPDLRSATARGSVPIWAGVEADAEIAFKYELNPTTWAYLSALLTIGIFFKFHRFWSVRNLDLIGLIVLSPGILLIFYGLVLGYAWLFAVGAFFMIRLLLDPVMVRRPLLEPNLNASGLTFTGTAILVFLAANLLAAKPDRLEHVLAQQHLDAGREAMAIRSPGYVKFYQLASYSNIKEYPPGTAENNAAHAVALLSLLALVLGIVVVGFRHFDNIHTGVAAASLYLLLPYAGQMTGRIDHLLPAALWFGPSPPIAARSSPDS